MKSIWAPTIISLQTFDFDKPGELTSLERNACISYYNQQHPDRVSSATEHAPLLLLLYVLASLHQGFLAKHYFGCVQNTPLTLYDIRLLCALGSHMVSRPTTVCISHAEALQQARDLAMQWLYPADAPLTIVQGSSSKSYPVFVTYQQGFCANFNTSGDTHHMVLL